ncbi:MAG: hypothetical protein NUV59_03870 [Patescibacteria group bacterium]|nr:hypothetical protein [Patescibacteria group bacterium]
MESEHDLLKKTYDLARENNRMLHAMRRRAFWGGIIKFIFYAVLLLAPLWLYMQYLAPMVDQALQTMQQVQGTGAKAEAQLSSFQEMLREFQSKIPGFGQSAQ